MAGIAALGLVLVLAGLMLWLGWTLWLGVGLVIALGLIIMVLGPTLSAWQALPFPSFWRTTQDYEAALERHEQRSETTPLKRYRRRKRKRRR